MTFRNFQNFRFFGPSTTELWPGCSPTFSMPKMKPCIPQGTSISHLSGFLASGPADLPKLIKNFNKHTYLHPHFANLANVPPACRGECFAPYLIECVCFCAAAQKITLKSASKSFEKASGTQENDFQKNSKFLIFWTINLRISPGVFHYFFDA